MRCPSSGPFCSSLLALMLMSAGEGSGKFCSRPPVPISWTSESRAGALCHAEGLAGVASAWDKGKQRGQGVWTLKEERSSQLSHRKETRWVSQGHLPL